MDKKILILFSILFPLFLLIFSLKTVLLFSSLSLPQQQWINYFHEKSPIPLGYTELEQSHMQDVKIILQKVDVLFFSLLLITTLLLTHYKKKKNIIKGLLIAGAKSTLISISSILIISSLAFNFIFTYFHKIFFPQGNWQFPPDSLLIQTWPINFFIQTSTKIFLLTLFLAIITIYISKKYIK